MAVVARGLGRPAIDEIDEIDNSNLESSASSASSVGQANRRHSQIRLHLPKRCCSKKEGKDDASTLLPAAYSADTSAYVPNTSCSIGALVQVSTSFTPAAASSQSQAASRHHASIGSLPIHVKSTPHADSGRADVASSERCRMGVPSPKKPWRAEAQRFAHTMGKRKRLGKRPPLDLLELAPLRIRSAWDHPRLAKAGTKQAVHFPWPHYCESLCRDKWAPWTRRRVLEQPCLQYMACNVVLARLRGGLQPCRIALCRQVICCAIVGRFARLNMCGASADCMWQPRKVATQQTVTVGLMWKVSSLPDTTTCGTSGLSSTP